MNSQASKDSDSAPLIASPERRPSGADASAADGYHNDASSPAYGSDSFHSPQPLLSPHPDAHQQGAPTPVTSAAYFPPSYGSGGNAPQLPAPPPTWGQKMAAARTTVVEQGDKTWLWSVLTAGVVVPTLLYRVCTGVLCPGEQTLMAWLVAGVSGSPVVSSWIPAVSKLCALHLTSCTFVALLSLLTLLWLLLGTALLLQSPMPSCESGTTMALTLAVAVLHWVGW
eukprot:CAMPEP_0178991910 /NCGR_PEP_ID=MMETSP0795-20121207/5805_1 /TAXON_ID=88552 /ORGANISM="Amoebophrya sp., Strain Ameob2" /LENGTH=225 /DNA_ID=CAMNT_0020683701 /DNA_START=112 /DNA_END=786 /DNA_ORIENTATION=+